MINFLTLNPFLEHIFFGNSIREYIIAVLLFVALLAFFKIIQAVILNKIAVFVTKTKSDIDDMLLSIVKNVKPTFYSFFAFFFAVKFLHVPESFHKILSWIMILWLTYQTVISLHILIDYISSKKIKTDSGNTKQALSTLSLISKVVLWVLGALFVLSNMGVNITSAVAGLGIGGIAVALALQNILGDLFSSFAIYFDKPFEIGDFIVVGDKVGTVEKIGIKTTRIKALQGEEIVFSNRELMNAQIQNFKKLKSRRISFSVGVTYDTPNTKLKMVPVLVNDLFKTINDVRLDRVHFAKFDESSLTFEIVYYAETSDYTVSMDKRQEINLGIKALFEKKGIEMAFPTRTLYMKKD